MKKSPLLEKLRGDNEPMIFRKKSVFAFPKRGRIRVVLALMIVAACIALARSSVPHRAPQTIKPTTPTSKQIAFLSHIKLFDFRLPHLNLFHTSQCEPGPVLPAWGLRPYTVKDVATVLAGHDPKFASEADTMRCAGKAFLIHYSIDTSLQNAAERFMKQYKPLYGAVCIIEPSTGRVRALVSYTRDGAPELGKNLYARSLFPSASTFKTVTAAGVIDSLGYTAETEIQTTGANHTLYKSQISPTPRWQAFIPLKEAFAYSINPAFARLGVFKLGAEGVTSYAGKFGFNKDIPFELPVEQPVFVKPDSEFEIAQAASGFNQKTCMSPLFGALIAASIEGGGKMPIPTLVDSMTDLATGKTVYTRASGVLRTPISKRAAQEIASMMQDVEQYGTARKGFRYVKKSSDFEEMTYGGKTGNVDKAGIGHTDWFIGFASSPSDPARDLAIGVVTMHDAYWTVHSSYIAAELMRHNVHLVKKAAAEDRVAAAAPKVPIRTN